MVCILPRPWFFKNLWAPATTAWGSKRRNKGQKPWGHDGGGGGAGLKPQVDAKECEDTDMEESDASRKRASDEVVGVPKTAASSTSLELVPIEKNNGSAADVPPSPPLKQDPKRSRLTQQSEKALNSSGRKNLVVLKNSDAKTAASPAEDR